MICAIGTDVDIDPSELCFWQIILVLFKYTILSFSDSVVCLSHLFYFYV